MEKSIKRLSVSDPTAILAAAEVLRNGGVVLYPTDTLYALGALSLQQEAYEKIYAIKGRADSKPIHSVVASLQTAGSFCTITATALQLEKAFLPGPLTLLLPRLPTTPLFATAGLTTFGVRIPNNPFCLALSNEVKQPFTATSANISGMQVESSVESILTQLGNTAGIIDLVIDAGTLPLSEPSSVLDLSEATPRIIRVGAISTSRIEAALGISI